MRTPVAFRKTSLVDYPGKVSAVLFFPGCNLRCPWCHNRGLVEPAAYPEEAELTDLEDALGAIGRRRAVLGGVVLSGGEPLLRRGLGALIARLKRLALAVKLDTNGTLPAALADLLSRAETSPDFVALDLKTAPSGYGRLAPSGVRVDWESALRQSAAILSASGVAHEYRSLALPLGYFAERDLEALAPLADGSPWIFSPFRSGNCLAREWNGLPSSAEGDAEALAEAAVRLGKDGRKR